jgi:hypothetical protein
MTVWHHSRRGRIEGDLLRQDDTWAHIRLTAPTDLADRALRPTQHDGFEAGETITVRREHLTEVIRPTTAQLLDFAARHPGKHDSRVDQAIRDELRITPTRYIQLLTDAIRTPEALQHDPQTTRRLLREEAAAEAARARRVHP